MSVDIAFYVGPHPTHVLSAQALQMFLRDLVQGSVLTNSWIVLGGELDTDPLGLHNQATDVQQAVTEPSHVTPTRIRSTGTELRSLIDSVAQASAEGKNFAVLFDQGVNLKNADMAKAFEIAQCYNGMVGVYNFTVPQTIEIFNAYEDQPPTSISLQQYFAISGTGAMYELVPSPLRDVIVRHFGDALVSGRCES